MANEKDNKKKLIIIGISCLVFVCLLSSAWFILSMLMREDSGKRKRQIQRVTLVKPPPPPKIKEKPPEPEIKKKEEIVEPEPEDQPEDEMDDSMDDEPPEGPLGLTDGVEGTDSFGMQKRPHGHDITTIGGGGGKSLMRRYSWYTRILSDEIREKVNKYLEDKEDIPSGKHKMLILVLLDDIGNMQLKTITQSSGNPVVDTAVENAVAGFRVSELPPDDMPKIIKLKITFKS